MSQKRCLPHYFIARNNLLDYYSDEEVQTLCVHIEALRVFPIQCIQHLCDAYGWGKTFTNAFFVLNDCEHFARTKDIDHAWVKNFIPASLRSIISMFFDKRRAHLKWACGRFGNISTFCSRHKRCNLNYKIFPKDTNECSDVWWNGFLVLTEIMFINKIKYKSVLHKRTRNHLCKQDF